MLYDYEDTIAVIEKLVQKMINESGISAPPVNPFKIAKILKIPCTESVIQGRRGQNFILNGHRIIDLNKDDRIERKCFTLAHELIEVLLPEKFKDKDERHDIAMLGAPYLLMPTDWFRKACEKTKFDLFLLKRIFTTASHEAIAIRTLSFDSAIITVIDNKKVTNRQSSLSTFAGKRLMPLEKEAVEYVISVDGDCYKYESNDYKCKVTAYPLFEEEVKRIILRTVPVDSFD